MNNSIAILSLIIYRVGRIHLNSFKTAATSEAAISQARDGVGNGDGGQTAATIEAVIAHARDGAGNGDGGQTATVIVFVYCFISEFYELKVEK